MDGTIYEFEGWPMSSQRPVAAPAPLRAGGGPTGGLVGVIRNPRSHRNKGHAPEMAERPDVLTRTPRTREELARDLAEMSSRGITMLAVDGGDGTVRDVLTCGAPCFGENWPRMIVLPKGKTNALAVDLGLPNHWSLAEALDAARQGPGVERRPVVVNGAGKQGGSIMGFFLGAGIFTNATSEGQVAHRYGAFNSFAVAVTAVSGILQGLFGTGHKGWRGITPIRLFLGAEEGEVPHSRHGPSDSRYAVLISTLDDFPLGMKPFGRQPEGLKYLLVDYPLRRVVAVAPALLAGWESPLLLKWGVHRGHAQEAVLDVRDKFILDGEAFPAGRFRLTLGPKLHFVAP
jgi:diacylglycerol kinase (ATP)